MTRDEPQGLSLFGELPVQKPPTVIRTGGRSIKKCTRCKGSGRHRYSYYSGGYTSERGSEPCEQCKGGGWIMPPKRRRRALAQGEAASHE